MSMDFDRFCLMILFEKLLAVELSTRMGLAGWGCPNSARVVRMGTASWPLRNVAPILASAEDNITLLMILETVCMGR